jgi:hypothetical protein
MALAVLLVLGCQGSEADLDPPSPKKIEGPPAWEQVTAEPQFAREAEVADGELSILVKGRASDRGGPHCGIVRAPLLSAQIVLQRMFFRYMELGHAKALAAKSRKRMSLAKRTMMPSPEEGCVCFWVEWRDWGSRGWE